jgi:hypothetical protein
VYSDRWSSQLRQGDIFGEIPLPLLKGKEVYGYSGGLAGTPQQIPVHVQIPTPPRWVIVVSHDCEFNEDKRTHFVVARIDSINPKTEPEEIEQLKYANDYARAVADKKQIPLDTFYLEPVEGAFEVAMRANFACLASLPMDYCEEALRLKQAELAHEQRILFRRKVGVFFGRDADDAPDDTKRPADEIRSERAGAEEKQA